MIQFTVALQKNDTIKVYEDVEEIPRGDDAEIPAAHQRMYKNNLDGYAFWLRKLYPGYVITITADEVGGLLPPFPYMNVWLDDDCIDMDTTIKLGRQYMKELYATQSNARTAGSTPQTTT